MKPLRSAVAAGGDASTWHRFAVLPAAVALLFASRGAHLEDSLGLLDSRQQVRAEVAELGGGGHQVAGGL